MSYRHLIAAMASLPADAQGMADAAGITRNRMYRLVKQMRRMGVIRVAEYIRDGRNTRIVYALSDGSPDLTVRCKLARESFQLALIWREMAEARTSGEIAEATGVCRRSVNLQVRRLIDAKLAHIAGWDWAHQVPVAAYQRGKGTNAKRPNGMSKAEINRRYWDARKARRLAARVMGMAA